MGTSTTSLYRVCTTMTDAVCGMTLKGMFTCGTIRTFWIHGWTDGATVSMDTATIATELGKTLSRFDTGGA